MDFNNRTYPTKKEILKTKPTIQKNTVLVLKTWKKSFIKKWKKKQTEEKLITLEFLIDVLNQVNNGGELKIKIGTEYKYDKNSKTIYQSKENPSIISALHELAHHLYGPSELSACSWSIHYFIHCFPEQYKKLKWEKHLLIKK